MFLEYGNGQVRKDFQGASGLQEAAPARSSYQNGIVAYHDTKIGTAKP